jgi:hypothetical protein
MYAKALTALFKASPYLTILGLLAFGAYKYNSLSNQLDAEKNAFKDFRAQHEALVLAQQNKLTIALETSKLRLTNAITKYENINAKLKKELYDKKILIAGLDSDVSQLQNSLRASLIARSESSFNTITTTEGWRNAYTTIDRQYDELKLACSITTNQFNLCRGYVDEVCSIVTCGD